MLTQMLKQIWRRSRLMLTIAIAICALTGSPAWADTAPPDPAYVEGLQSMRDQIKAAPNKPSNLAFNDVLNQLFTSPAIQVNFRQTSDKAGVKTVVYSGAIFFSQGDVFINYNKTTNDDNFATINGKLYTWKNNAKKGEILTRFPGDTLGFLMYMIDPSAIMRSIYMEYLEKPEQFTIKTTQANQKALTLKQAISGFQSLTLQDKPFWLKGFEFSDPKQPEQGVGRWEIDSPIALETLPKVLYTLPAGVNFQPSTKTLRERMVYL